MQLRVPILDYYICYAAKSYKPLLYSYTWCTFLIELRKLKRLRINPPTIRKEVTYQIQINVI